MRFQIRSVAGGISDYEDRGITGSFKFASGIDIRKRLDSISCQQTLVDEDEGVGVITGLIRWIVPSTDGNTYGFDDIGRIYKRDTSGVWSSVFMYGADGDIRGACEWYNSSGKTYLYWASATKLHRKELPGQTNWSDVDNDAGWPKTNLTDVPWHTMRQAGGALMIANGDKLAMVGYDDSYTNEALRIYPDERIKAVTERQDYVVLGSYKNNDSEKGTLYSWKQEALSYIQRKEIPVQGVNALVDTEVTLAQAGTNGTIVYSDLANIIPVSVIPDGGQVNPDGAEMDEGLALFGVFGITNSGVYSLGRKKKNSPFVLNLEYPLGADEIGSVKNIGSTILVSYKSGSTYGVKSVSSTLKGTGVYNSLDLVAPKEFLRPVVWKSVVINTKEMPAGSSISLAYRVNKGDIFTQAYLEGGVQDFTAGTEAVFLIGATGRVFEFQLTLTPIGNLSPEVLMPINVYFA